MIPTWMTDAGACAEFTFGAPMASLEALVELRSLLDSIRAHQGAKMKPPGCSDTNAGGGTESK